MTAGAQRSTERPRLAEIRRRVEGIPLQARLIAVLSVLLAGALVLTTLVTAILMERDLGKRVDAELRATARPVIAAATSYFKTGGNGPDQSLLSGYYVVVFDHGQPIPLAAPTGVSQVPAIPPIATTDAHVRNARPFTVNSTNGDVNWRVIAGLVVSSDQQTVLGTFAVAVPLTTVEHTVSRLLLVTGLIGVVVLMAAAFAGWYLIRRAFRPLTQIEDTAAAIAEGDLTQRIPTRRADDEVSSLSRSLNAMLAQIEQSFSVREASEDRMRQFVSDASHELRTPLATVRGYAELYRQGAVSRPEDVASAMGRIEGEATRMGGLVEDLLTLARLDEEPTAAIQPVDLTVLAADATQDARALAPERRITLRTLGSALGPVVVDGTEPRLRQVFTNLLANAVRHTPSGTPIEVAVGFNDEHDHGRIEVRDHGAGIDDATARKVFERFYRSDFARSRESGGSGLGLAIVAAIVAGHDGRVGVAHTPGGGATFVVELPTANSQPEHTGL
ncbi:MAG: HAMP domain-containing sensor histidine kinase [Nostocoides sp.]